MWTGPQNVYWNGTTPIGTLNLGQLYQIDDVQLLVDNNDSYAVEWSLNGSVWNNLFSVSVGHGEIGWGMDTMSTLSGNGEYIAVLDFTAIQAQYLRIFATGGDNKYSVGEVQAFGSVSNVPVPAAVWLFISALLGLSTLNRKTA